MKITITRNGPYAVSGGVPLLRETIGANAAGESIEWVGGDAIAAPAANYALCRCGHSANKPFCDGSHARVGFDGTETASRQPYLAQAQALEGPTEALTDAEPLCAFARFCDREGSVWRRVSEARSGHELQSFNRQVGQCPSGRLVAWDAEARRAIEPELTPSIAVTQDPQQGVSGPLWVRGGLEVVGADGTAYEARNRVTLCRCGQSNNKPFCDGTHASVGFKDWT